jgi:hypothetical protein
MYKTYNKTTGNFQGNDTKDGKLLNLTNFMKSDNEKQFNKFPAFLITNNQ